MSCASRRWFMLPVCRATLHQTANLDGTGRVQWNGNQAELMLISGFRAEE